ncbi:MAG: LlaJI family restriction endonuclease [Staphylococcus equorum]|nr:LlaJI family restriction endonuclease [Staphylococcus equorum]
MKRLISEFVREQKRYSKNDIKNIFKLKTEEIDGFVKKLNNIGVLKFVKNNPEQRDLSDLIDTDIENLEIEFLNDTYYYVFTYVGVITVGRRVIKCYPKYILKNDNPIDEMKQILKVLSRYNANEQIINFYNGDGDNKRFNLLAIMLFLINDYYEYGVYNNTEDIIEINGDGEILWDKTISNSLPLISNNRPYYMEFYTKRTIDDEYDFIKRLHKCVLTQCSKQLEITGLLDLFDIPSINISEKIVDDFGDREYILYRLQSELNIQFNTRKQILIKTIYAYLAQENTLEDTYGISMYGTNNFNLVWEKICSEVFSNKLNTKLGCLELPKPLSYEYNSNARLIDIIEKPTWIGYRINESGFEKKSKDTLIPDLVSVGKHETRTYFIIFDAKYYNLQLEEGKELRNYPGIGDITKQYLYQLVYKKFIEDHSIEFVKNCFLIPIEGDRIIKKGVVKMNIFNELGLQDIQIIFLPAKVIYDKYLTKKVMDISMLGL